MKYRRLGRTNLQVSELCLGTMMFGDQTDPSEAARIVASARERGVNFIDTADVYTTGASERVLAPLIAAGRDDWILASKVGNTMSDRPNEGRYSRKWMMREVDASLERLGTDYIDLYYLHRDFEDETLEEAVRALEDMTRAGKIRYFGLSNYRGWRIAEVVRVCDALGVARPAALQPYYNLLNRVPEVEILPACASYGLGVVPYSPIARGVLSGKYLPGQTPEPGSRAARKDKRIMETEWRAESLEIAQTLAAHAERRGITLVQFAVAWLLANQVLSSVIAGPRTLSQWEGYFGAIDFAWQPEDEALVNSLVVPGHSSTPGYNDPSYPFFGRRLA